ncbi:CsiV family protein [Marinospirillum alkaliphilum]|uniref:Peptidoglycan-binding protein, CsiV n=1 Tax=Marinospirillum alkaliphilum DSM 21637 TaxID=1122209 RepID=A0A1K1U5Z8_9GAMM|nr:CsiV family protein [Marinospirillum alkaliphilum]SFX08052.1 Peptidoglycan-binding protein, CsiV [Marinospirillum alkaliphilum DSM 21637]
MQLKPAFGTCLLLLALLLPAPPLQAEDTQPHRNERDYLIEVLIFTQTPATNSTEKPGRPQIFEPVTAAAMKIGPSPAWSRLNYLPQPLYEPIEVQLVREAAAIERSRDYRVLFHDAWRMHVVGEDRSIPLLIEGGNYYDGMPELQGTLKVMVARYLHVETDLYFSRFEAVPEVLSGSVDQVLLDSRNPLSLSATSTQLQLPALIQPPTADELRHGSSRVEGRYQPIDSARMHQRRRMRSNELHFIDSPYMGLLIRIERAPEREVPAATR